MLQQLQAAPGMPILAQRPVPPLQQSIPPQRSPPYIPPPRLQVQQQAQQQMHAAAGFGGRRWSSMVAQMQLQHQHTVAWLSRLSSPSISQVCILHQAHVRPCALFGGP